MMAKVGAYEVVGRIWGLFLDGKCLLEASWALRMVSEVSLNCTNM